MKFPPNAHSSLGHIRQLFVLSSIGRTIEPMERMPYDTYALSLRPDQGRDEEGFDLLVKRITIHVSLVADPWKRLVLILRWSG